MAFKLNNSDNYEALLVYLSKDKTPIAFENMINELMAQGTFEKREDAEEWVSNTPIELELYYEEGCGLFAVESNAVENSCEIYSPYSRECGIVENEGDLQRTF